jgi:hypothetical protein
MKSMNGWFVASIVVAAIAFWVGPGSWLVYSGGNGIPSADSVAFSVWLGWIWFATAIIPYLTVTI